MVSCVVCGADDVNLALIDGISINVCKECGGIFISDWNMIIQLPMPLAINNNLYAVSAALAFLYKQLESGSVPIPESG